MTKILGPLVVAVLVGLGAGESDPPPYKEYAREIDAAGETLIINIISMDNNIPFLNDTRRQYAEIVHVIIYSALKKSVYPYSPYDEQYYNYLNSSVAEGLNHPENVVVEIKNLLDAVHQNFEVMLHLILRDCPSHISPASCDEVIHDIIKGNQTAYGIPALVFLAAGRAATEFNKNHGKFEEVSNDFNAYQYVVKSPDDMRILVEELVHLYITLHDLQQLPL